MPDPFWWPVIPNPVQSRVTFEDRMFMQVEAESRFSVRYHVPAEFISTGHAAIMSADAGSANARKEKDRQRIRKSLE